MKLFALIAAGAVALGTLAAPAPVEAQRYGAYGHHDGYRGRAHYQPRRYYRGGRARVRTVCRARRGYYGGVRRCFRVYR